MVIMSESLKISLMFGQGDGIHDKEEIFEENELKQLAKQVCKPCWELKYCPYGPLVENFPLPPIPRKQAIEHNEYLKSILKSGRFPDGRIINSDLKKEFQSDVDSFNPNDYPEEINETIKHMSCSEFGHLCPSFFVSEPFTETKDVRYQGRRIPRDILIRVIRRDNSICQKCKTVLLDRDIEVDHIIPIAKGGATSEANLQVLCFTCNRTKGSKIENLLNERAEKNH
jgi:5-methylcytosine-specific restriction endonuclease McrA